MVKYTYNPDSCIEEIKKGLAAGAEAFGIQCESLPRGYHNKEDLTKIFFAMEDKPIYVTNYKLGHNANLPYEELAEELLRYCDYGATLIDMTGDYFCMTEGELTFDAEALKKQRELVDRIHDKGCEVLISSHINKVTSAERVVEVALEHQRRGADISKIVVHANTVEEEIEALRITAMLKDKLDIKYLYLAGGESCLIQRRLGMLLGNCMSLCMFEPINGSKEPTVQPLISEQIMCRDKLNFIKNN